MRDIDHSRKGLVEALDIKDEERELMGDAVKYCVEETDTKSEVIEYISKLDVDDIMKLMIMHAYSEIAHKLDLLSTVESIKDKMSTLEKRVNEEDTEESIKEAFNEDEF